MQENDISIYLRHRNDFLKTLLESKDYEEELSSLSNTMINLQHKNIPFLKSWVDEYCFNMASEVRPDYIIKKAKKDEFDNVSIKDLIRSNPKLSNEEILESLKNVREKKGFTGKFDESDTLSRINDIKFKNSGLTYSQWLEQGGKEIGGSTPFSKDRILSEIDREQNFGSAKGTRKGRQSAADLANFRNRGDYMPDGEGRSLSKSASLWPSAKSGKSHLLDGNHPLRQVNPINNLPYHLDDSIKYILSGEADKVKKAVQEHHNHHIKNNNPVVAGFEKPSSLRRIMTNINTPEIDKETGEKIKTNEKKNDVFQPFIGGSGEKGDMSGGELHSKSFEKFKTDNADVEFDGRDYDNLFDGTKKISDMSKEEQLNLHLMDWSEKSKSKDFIKSNKTYRQHLASQGLNENEISKRGENEISSIMAPTRDWPKDVKEQTRLIQEHLDKPHGDDYHHGVGLLTHLLGIEFLSPQDRTTVLNHLEEHGSDDNEKQRVKLSNGTINMSHLKTQFKTRVTPMINHALRKPNFSGPNVNATFEDPSLTNKLDINTGHIDTLLENLHIEHDDESHPDYNPGDKGTIKDFNKGQMLSHVMKNLGPALCKEDAERALAGDDNLSLSDLLDHHDVDSFMINDKNGKKKNQKFTTEASFNATNPNLETNKNGETWKQTSLREKRAAVEHNAIEWPSLEKEQISLGNLSKSHIKDILNWSEHYRKLDNPQSPEEKKGKASPLWEAFKGWSLGNDRPHVKTNEDNHKANTKSRSVHDWKWEDMVNFMGLNESIDEKGETTYTKRKHDLTPLLNESFFTSEEMKFAKQHYIHNKGLTANAQKTRNQMKAWMANTVHKDDLPKDEDGSITDGVDKGFLEHESKSKILEGLGRFFSRRLDTHGGAGISDTQLLDILHDVHATEIKRDENGNAIYSKSIFGEKGIKDLGSDKKGNMLEYIRAETPLIPNEAMMGMIYPFLPANLPAGVRQAGNLQELLSPHGKSAHKINKDENGDVVRTSGSNNKNNINDASSVRNPKAHHEVRRGKLSEVNDSEDTANALIDTYRRNDNIHDTPYIDSSKLQSIISDGRTNAVARVKHELGMSQGVNHRNDKPISDRRKTGDIDGFWGHDFGQHNDGNPKMFVSHNDILNPENAKLKLNDDIDDSDLIDLLSLTPKGGREAFEKKVHDFTEKKGTETQQGTIEDIHSILENLKIEQQDLKTRKDSRNLPYDTIKNPTAPYKETSQEGYQPLNPSEENRLKDLGVDITHLEEQRNKILNDYHSNTFTAEKNRHDTEELGRTMDSQAKLDFAKNILYPKVISMFPDAFNAEVVGAHQVKVNMAQLLHDAEIGLLTVPHEVHGLMSHGPRLDDSKSKTIQQIAGKSQHRDIQNIMSKHGIGLNDFGEDEHGNTKMTEQNLLQSLGMELNEANLMYANNLIKRHSGKASKLMTLGQLLSLQPTKEIPKKDENGRVEKDENGKEILIKHEHWKNTTNSQQRKDVLNAVYKKAEKDIQPTMDRVRAKDENDNFMRDENGNLIYTEGKMKFKGGSFDAHPQSYRVRSEHFKNHPAYNQVRELNNRLDVPKKTGHEKLIKDTYGLEYEKFGDIRNVTGKGKKANVQNLENMLDSVIAYDSIFDESINEKPKETIENRRAYTNGQLEIHPVHEGEGRVIATSFTGNGIAGQASVLRDAQANFGFNYDRKGGVNIGGFTSPRAYVPPPAGVFSHILGEEQHQMNTNAVLGDQTSAQFHENPITSADTDGDGGDLSLVAKAQLPTEMPLIEPLHKIFKVSDIEQLRGFTGEWVVSVQEDGKRLKVKRAGNRITLTDENAQRVNSYSEMDKYFRKITAKNYVIDAVMNDEGIFINDIMHYDGTDVTDLDTRDRMKLLRGQFESYDFIHVLSPSTLKITDEDGLENAVKDLLSENKESTYMKGEEKHPKWIMMTKSYDNYHIPFGMEIDDSHFILHFAEDIVKYEILDDGHMVDVWNPKSVLGELYEDNDYPITLAKSLEDYWQPAFHEMWKAEKKKKEMIPDIVPDAKKIEEESAGIIDADDESQIMKPKDAKMLKTLELIERALDVLEKANSNMAGRGLGIDVGAQIESPRGPTSLRSEQSMPDWDMLERPSEDMEKPEKYPGRDKKKKINEINDEDLEDGLENY